MDGVASEWFEFIDCYQEYQKQRSSDGHLKYVLNRSKNVAYDLAQNQFVRFAGTAALIGGGAYVAAPIILNGIGFGAAGVAKGAAAAKLQAAWFGGHISGITGAVFSASQSVSAAGFAVPGKMFFAAGGLLAAKELNGNKGVQPKDLTSQISWRLAPLVLKTYPLNYKLFACNINYSNFNCI